MNELKSLYIHIPFCKKKCNYCDFVSYPDKEDLIDDYVNTIIKELHHSSFVIRNSKLETIYFGGGTPTLLEPKHFEKILETLTPFPSPSGRGAVKGEHEAENKAGVRALEISLEANPGTADKQKLKELRQLGINRLSMGAQSFNDNHLRTLGRIHDSKTALKFYEDARSAGFDNINLDLIFALPGQTLSDWQSDLNQALHLKPNHLSTYNLIIEEGTNFFNKYKNQEQEAELAMYEYTIETLTKHGFEHYEISNFARPGHECQHNIVYWRNENYLGVGAGAHSHVNGQRWANSNSIEEYIKSTQHPKPKPINHTSLLTQQPETIFMGLRLLDGLEAKKFTGFEKELNELIETGLLTRENSHIKLTKQGLYLANEVFEKFV